MTEADFNATLAAAAAGDEGAARSVFDHYQPMLLRYVRSQAPGHAEDISSEVWLVAVDRLVGFDGEEAQFRAWLFTVARRRVIDLRRREGRRRTNPVDPELFDSRHGAEDPADAAASSADAQRALELMAEHLSADQTEVLILRVVADLTAAQVAELMDRPESWVRVTQYRALKTLAARLDARMELIR